jgi:hypothetical protein
MKSQNRWLSEKRPLIIKNLFENFFESHTAFQEIYNSYISDKALSFEDFRRLVGTEFNKGKLWELKDQCHLLWKEVILHKGANGYLLDWMVGSIFHGAMKLKENAYLLQNYDPEKINDDQGGEYRQIRNSISREIGQQMNNMGGQFSRANYLFRLLINEESQNLLLLRFLVENEAEVNKMWFEPLEEIFEDIFPGGADFGFCMAARSYIQGHWHEHAFRAYQKALAINKNCQEAEREVLRLKGIINRTM